MGHSHLWSTTGTKGILAEDPQLYRLIYESVKIALIVIADAQGNIVKWNRGAENAFGYAEEEILGRPTSLLMANSKARYGISALIRWARMSAEGHDSKVLELTCLHKTGKTFPVECVVSRLDHANGALYALKMLDITKRIEFQDRLLQKTKELELFLYRSAHDLNAPFSSARGLIELMKGEESMDRMQELVEMLERTISHAMKMSDGLARASMINEGPSVPVPINFLETIEEVVQGLKGCPNFEYNTIHMDVEDAGDFVADRELVLGLFRNLIENSIKFSIPPSRGHLPFIKIKVRALEEQVQIMVCDNGRGIKKCHLDNIFKSYYKANVEEFHGSSGLGLYIVKRIIDSFNGEISVESQAGAGSCFSIQFAKSNTKK